LTLKLTHPLLAATLGILMAFPGAPAAAQEGKLIGYVMNERGESKPVRKLDKSEIPFYSVVCWFYRDVLTSYRYGEAAQNQDWQRLGVKPDSPEANSILKAAFRAQALFLDFPQLPFGASDQEFREAQYKAQQREVRELQAITLTMIRELRSGGAPLHLWELYLEQKIRPSISVKVYGEKGEYDRKLESLQQDFEAVVRAGLEPAEEVQ